ncbi:Ig-like domain-containing protein [Eoetvoesiella caeni]
MAQEKKINEVIVPEKVIMWSIVCFLTFFSFFGLTPANAGYYVNSNQYYINTEAGSEAAFRSCPVRQVNATQVCTGTTVVSTPYYWCEIKGGIPFDGYYGHYYTSPQFPTYEQARQDCNNYWGLYGYSWPNGVYIEDNSGSNQETVCSSWGTNYSLGSCLSESYSRSIGLGPYIDSQLATYNQPPVVDAKSLTTKQGVAGSVTLSGRDSDGTISHYGILNASPYGSAVISGATLTFTPNPNWYGTTSLTYGAVDNMGAWSSPATVTIQVTERKLILSDFVYNSEMRSGEVKATGVDEIPQSGVVKLLSLDGSVAFQVDATRQGIDTNSALYSYDVRNAPAGSYNLQIEIKDSIGGIQVLSYGEISIFKLSTIEVSYDTTYRSGVINVSDKGSNLQTALVHLVNSNGVVAFTANALCSPSPEFSHSCEFSLNAAPEGTFDAQVELTDDFGFSFTSMHGQILIDKTPPVITAKLPQGGKVGAVNELGFKLVDNFDPNIQVQSIVLKGGADNLDQPISWSKSGNDVELDYFVIFPTHEGDDPYTLTINVIDHQLNVSERIVAFTYHPELMELVADLSKLGMDGRLAVPAVDYEFRRTGDSPAIVTKPVKRRNGQLLEGIHDVFVTMRKEAISPLLINGTLVLPGQTVKVIEAQDFTNRPDLKLTAKAATLDHIGMADLLVSISAPDTPVLQLPAFTWAGDIVLQSKSWEFRQVVDPINITAMPGAGVPCRITVDALAAKRADPFADPVCLLEWTQTPDEAEVSKAEVGGMRVAGLTGQAVRLGVQSLAYNVYLYSGDGTKVLIGNGAREINVVSALNSILFAPAMNPLQAHRKIQDLDVRFKQSVGPTCGLTLSADQAIQTASRGIRDGEPRSCLFEWQQMPQGLTQNKYGDIPQSTGTLDTLGAHKLGWRLSMFSRNGTRITLAEQTADIEVIDPPAPVVGLESSFTQVDDVLMVPITGSYFGDAVVTGENAALNMAITRNAEAVESETYPKNAWAAQQRIMRRLSAPNSALWAKSTYTIKAAYAALPEVQAEKTYTVYAMPGESIKPFVETTAQAALDTEMLPLTVDMRDTYRIRDPYNAATMGEWRVRVLRQEGSAEPVPLTDFVPTVDGKANFSVDISDVATRSLRLIAEAELISPIEGYTRIERSTRALFLAVLLGGEIDGTVIARRLSGQAPFSAVFKAGLVNREMSASTGAIVWETSADGGATWEEFIPAERYKFQYTRVFAKGTYQVRAKIANKYSGKTAYTELVEIVAYDKPTVQITGPKVKFVGTTATLSAKPVLESMGEKDGKPVKVYTEVPMGEVDIQWSLDGGKTYTQAGQSLALTSEEAKRFSVWAKIRTQHSPEVDNNAYTIVKNSVEFKPVRAPRVRVQGPNVIEVGKPYTFNALTGLPYKDMEEVLNGFFTLPDGTTVQGVESAVYTPTEADLATGMLNTTYTVWIEGFRDQGAEASNTLRSRVWQYVWPKFMMDYRGDALVAPANLTLRVRPMGFSGKLETPTYTWELPKAGITVTDASNDVLRLATVTEPGKYVAKVTVRDARGHEAVVEYPFEIGTPEPYTIDLKYSASNTQLREPVDILLRPEIRGGHPRDRVAQLEFFANDVALPGTGLYGRTTLSAGENTLGLKITSSMGKVAEANIALNVAENQLPECSLTSRETVGSVVVYAECTDPDGRIRSYEWTVDGKVLASASKWISVTKRPGEALPAITLTGMDDSGGRSETIKYTPAAPKP